MGIWKGADIPLTGQGPRIRSPLHSRGSPAGLQTNYLPPPLAPQRAPEPGVLPEPIRTALYSYCRLRAVTSAMAAAAAGSWRSATPYHTLRNAASPPSRRVGTTQERRTGDGEKPALFRFRVARRKCKWGAFFAGARRSPSGWGRRIPGPGIPGPSDSGSGYLLPLRTHRPYSSSTSGSGFSTKGSSLPDETFTCLAPSFQPQRFFQPLLTVASVLWAVQAGRS